MSKVQEFIDKYHGGRLKPSTLQFYRSNPRLMVASVEMDDYISIAACGTNGDKLIVLTHPDYVNQGWGTKVLNMILVLLKNRGIKPVAFIAEDNVASRRIAEKNALQITNKELSSRESGNYTLLTYRK